MGQQHAFVLADRLLLAVRAAETRLALQDHEHVVFVGMGVELVLAVVGVRFQRDPHFVRRSHGNVGAPQLGQLGLQLEERRFAFLDLRVEGCVQIVGAFCKIRGLGGRSKNAGHEPSSY
jgi:hypothetical protein